MIRVAVNFTLARICCVLVAMAALFSLARAGCLNAAKRVGRAMR